MASSSGSTRYPVQHPASARSSRTFGTPPVAWTSFDEVQRHVEGNFKELSQQIIVLDTEMKAMEQRLQTVILQETRAMILQSEERMKIMMKEAVQEAIAILAPHMQSFKGKSPDAASSHSNLSFVHPSTRQTSTGSSTSSQQRGAHPPLQTHPPMQTDAGPSSSAPYVPLDDRESLTAAEFGQMLATRGEEMSHTGRSLMQGWTGKLTRIKSMMSLRRH